ncbi:MAG: methyltransferase domain-containing protein [Gammaproteobacteria bacterium]|nr:methyltransferase domain-containing protein [Gammaproteobacteria bacterium]
MAEEKKINSNYTRFYADRIHHKVYPTEFVVRTLLANYPQLNFVKPKAGDRILDVAFGDGRNTVLLCDLGLDVCGIEITKDIVEQTGSRLAALGYNPDLRVGRNNNIPWDDETFDYILGCHCVYYCDDGETLLDNMLEYYRALKPNGFMIASIANRASYIFDGADELEDGTSRIKSDPYGNRYGYRLHGFFSEKGIEAYLSRYFFNFSFAHANNDYYGINERVFWVVCQRKPENFE